MTSVVELRDLKKGRPWLVSGYRQRALPLLCGLRFRVACFGVFGMALSYPVDGGVTARDSVLVTLCDVLTAAVSATFALLCDASRGLSALLSDPPSPIFGLAERLSRYFGEPLLPFDACPAARPFPTFSALQLCALAVCALLLFGCNLGRGERPGSGGRR